MHFERGHYSVQFIFCLLHHLHVLTVQEACIAPTPKPASCWDHWRTGCSVLGQRLQAGHLGLTGQGGIWRLYLEHPGGLLRRAVRSQSIRRGLGGRHTLKGCCASLSCEMEGSLDIASACSAFVLPSLLMHCIRRGEQYRAEQNVL